MNILDVVIILIFIYGAFIGFKRGFSYQLASSIGFFLIVILAFYLKNPISAMLYKNLPFFPFGGFIKGVTVLNIVLYEVIAFLIILSILIVVLKVVLNATNIFEKILKFTIVLTPISKIGGLIVGLVESYIWAFLIIYILSMPVFNVAEFNESKLKTKILTNTPVLSNVMNSSINVISEFADLKDKYKNETNPEAFNKDTLELFLKYKVVKPESVDVLVEKDKIKINNIDEILDKYRSE